MGSRIGLLDFTLVTDSTTTLLAATAALRPMVLAAGASTCVTDGTTVTARLLVDGTADKEFAMVMHQHVADVARLPLTRVQVRADTPTQGTDLTLLAIAQSPDSLTWLATGFPVAVTYFDATASTRVSLAPPLLDVVLSVTTDDEKALITQLRSLIVSGEAARALGVAAVQHVTLYTVPHGAVVTVYDAAHTRLLNVTTTSVSSSRRADVSSGGSMVGYAVLLIVVATMLTALIAVFAAQCARVHP